MHIKWNKVLVYLDISAPALVLFIAILLFIKNKTKLLLLDSVLLLFLAIQITSNSLGNYLQDQKINNHWVYHLNCFVTVSLFVYFFYFTSNSGKLKFIFTSGYLIFILFFILNILFIQTYSSFNSYSYALGSFLLVIFSLVNFQNILLQLPSLNIFQLKTFWFNAGILLYFGSCFFIFISYHYLSSVSSKYVGILWKTHNVFLAIGCLIFLKALTSKEWMTK